VFNCLQERLTSFAIQGACLASPCLCGVARRVWCAWEWCHRAEHGKAVIKCDIKDSSFRCEMVLFQSRSFVKGLNF
jgi:hypothetical protein